MGKNLKYGTATYYYGQDDGRLDCAEGPILRLAPVKVRGVRQNPNLGDRTLLLLLQRKMPKEVTFARAYNGWREGGSREEIELGEGRAFLRWLQRHELGIQWSRQDLQLHPYFQNAKAPRHDPQDETAKGLSFAIAPVEINDRKVKLYVQDLDMLRLIHTNYGHEEDFLTLVKNYVTQRHQWQAWQAPAPSFFDWVSSKGQRAVFLSGQLGFMLPV